MLFPAHAESASILVVEDDASLLLTMREYFTRAGLQVETAANGWEATRRIRQQHFDLVVTESEIADMDGARLREKFLLNPESREVPFLFLVPNGQPEKHVIALRGGIDDCIDKPFDPVVLVARAQALLARKTSYEQFIRIDPLTRLLNRATLQRSIEEELSRAARYDRTATMILMDIDEFRKVNEDAGVAMGDLMLTCFAGVILSAMRNVDKAGRVRGEKFLIFLPETDEAGARVVTQRIQERLANITDVVAGYPLTFSAGIVAFPAHGTDAGVIFERLEAAHANAKEFTRGAVTVWSEDLVATDSTGTQRAP